MAALCGPGGAAGYVEILVHPDCERSAPKRHSSSGSTAVNGISASDLRDKIGQHRVHKLGDGVAAKEFGPYQIEELLGRGGMGEVHRAYDTARKRTVALKRLPPYLADDQTFQMRFRREAEVAAGLTEPHIIPIHDYGEIDGQLFIDMRLVQGADLASLLATDGPLTAHRAVSIVAQVASALAAAHAVDLVHRDVKPSNILLSSGGDDYVYLVDFGLAHTPGATAMTSTGLTIGTLAYMAPERFTGRPTDRRVDIYALGCVLFEALTAKPAFPGEGGAELMYGHLNTPPPAPSRHRADLPLGLDAVVAQAMAKDPDDRYPTTTDVAAAAIAALDVPTAAAQPLARTATPHGTTKASTRSSDMTVAPSRPDGPVTPNDPPISTSKQLSPSRPTASSGTQAAEVSLAPTRLAQSASSHASPRLTNAERKKPVAKAGTIIAALATAGLVILAVMFWPRSALPTRDGQLVAPPPATKISKPLDRPPSAVGSIPASVPTRSSVAVAPDGQTVYVASADDAGGILLAIDPARSAVRATVRLGNTVPLYTAVTPDSRRVYIVSAIQPFTRKLDVLDVSSNTVSVAVSPRNDSTTMLGVVIAPGGQRGYVWNSFGPILVLNTVTNTVSDTVQTACNQSGIGNVAVSPDGSRLYVTCNSENGLYVIDAETKTVVSSNPSVERSEHLAMAPDGGVLLVAQSGGVSLIDGRTTVKTAAIALPDADIIHKVAVSPDGAHGYVVASSVNKVGKRNYIFHVIDLVTHEVVGTVQLGSSSPEKSTAALAIGPDGRRAYATWVDSGAVAVLDTGSN